MRMFLDLGSGEVSLKEFERWWRQEIVRFTAIFVLLPLFVDFRSSTILNAAISIEVRINHCFVTLDRIVSLSGHFFRLICGRIGQVRKEVMTIPLKMMKFALMMMNFALKMANFALKMANFGAGPGRAAPKGREYSRF